MSTPSSIREVVGGVDTHKDTHFAAVITTTGQRLAATQFPATSAGYEALLAFITSFGALLRIGVEGTNSYGAGLARRLDKAGITVLEVLQPGRRRQGTRGKTDEIDAYRAAETALAQNQCAQPKNSQGLVEQMRVITIARASAVSARAEALTQISNILITAPDDLRERYRNMPTRRRLQVLGRIRCGSRDNGVIVTTKRTLKSLATRIRSLSLEIDEHDEALKKLINTANPSLLQTRGIGVISAAALLISAGDNQNRLASEAQFAMHTGAAPNPASSGPTMRYRLNRGGDRKANHALHTIAIVRLHTCPRTRSYAVRRKSEGKSRKDILRCLKRAIAREVYHLLTTPPEIVDPSHLRQLRVESGCTLTETADRMGCSIAKLSCAERGVLNDREFLAVYRAHLEQQNTVQSAA